ncbi:TonB-dependent receptor, partial [bacterium]|nr:TonB-dependent receptor [bacterium]
MDYDNQLVKTGKINNVGTAIMTNIPKSYRTGIEISGGIKILKIIDWQANTTFSRNKIIDFSSYVDNWDIGGQNEIYIGETNLSFSPEIIVGSILSFEIIDNLHIALISKYVDKQYIDNTSSKDRMLDSYFINNIKLDYSIKTKMFKSIDFHFLLNNVFNEEYETDAWVYRYYLNGDYYNMDGYFPQAGIHFIGGITLKF